MGIHYDRLDISKENSLANGSVVPLALLEDKLNKMVHLVAEKSSCVLTDVVNNIYMNQNVKTR